MLVTFEPGRIRRNSDQPTAITDVPVATSLSTWRTCDIPLGTPTCLARTRRGIWALYPNGAGAVVLWPGGAIAGSSEEVAGELGRLGDGYHDLGRDDLDRAAASAIRQFLAEPDAHAHTGWPAIRARTWSSPATGYWLSSPTNQAHHDNHMPSSWPGAPTHPPRPLAAQTTPPGRAQPEPNPKPTLQRAA